MAVEEQETSAVWPWDCWGACSEAVTVEDTTTIMGITVRGATAVVVITKLLGLSRR